MPPSNRLKIFYSLIDFPIEDLYNSVWLKAEEIAVTEYWSGASAPANRHFRVRLLWSNTALYIRFEANQTEPLVINEAPALKNKTVGLWDRDVCEIFVAPDISDAHKYFEFEIAPTGEWIDLAIHVTPSKRETDRHYSSGMQSAARIENDKVMMAIKIPWEAFGARQKAGDIWHGNLFRCVGQGSTRGYLAWQPTKTAEPNFHVPEAFGEFKFVD